MENSNALFNYALRLADTNLVLGHRLSEMCSRAPFLEEDIALSNFALDHIGQAEALLQHAAKLEGKGRTEDDLAYLRPEWEYRNCLLAEQPNTDFAYVIVRQFLLDVFQCLVYEALAQSKDEALAAFGARFLKEAIYHRKHSGGWILRLGLGTDESRARLKRTVGDLWKFTAELFEADAEEKSLAAAGLVPDSTELYPEWLVQVARQFDKAGLQIPTAEGYQASGGRQGRHTEHLGHLLAEMQYLQRAHPGATW